MLYEALPEPKAKSMRPTQMDDTRVPTTANSTIGTK
jgi:hypothetical protein